MRTSSTKHTDAEQAEAEVKNDIAVVPLLAMIVWLVLRLAEPIGARLGTGGFNIATRVMGLILAAMAVQFMADGMPELFPGLAC